MFLNTTGGKKSEEIRKDGTRRTEWYPHALSHLVDLFHGRGTGSSSDHAG
jgi:hypothetical protein